MNPLKLFTTAQPVGVALRDLILSAGSVIAVFGILGMLSDEQTTALQDILPEIAVAAPAVVTAIGTLMGLGVSVYRIITKSSSDKAAEVAKEVDAKVPKADPVEIKTPGPGPNIRVPGEK